MEVKKLPESEIELSFLIPVEELDKFQEKVISNLSKDIKISGFRKGKAPREIVKEKVGQEKIFKDAAELCIRENYLKAVRQLAEEKKIELLGQPDIKIIKLAPNNPLEFKATISVLPEVILPDYRKIVSDIKRKNVSVSEKEIEDALEWLRQSRAKFTTKVGSSQEGDFVKIEFSSPQIENGAKKQESFVLGKGHLIPGFEDELVGLKNGEEKRFSLVGDENSPNPEIKGKNIDFSVKMLLVQKMELPSLTDDWAKSLGQFNGLSDLRESIKKGILLEKNKAEEEKIRQEILKKITEKSKVEIPKILIEEEKNVMEENLKRGVSESLNISFQDYLNQVGKTEEEIKESFSLEAKERVKRSLVLRAIGDKEKLVVSEEEIEKEVNNILRQYSSVKEAESHLDIDKVKTYVERMIKDEKTFQILESLIQK